MKTDIKQAKKYLKKRYKNWPSGFYLEDLSQLLTDFAASEIKKLKRCNCCSNYIMGGNRLT